MTALLVKYLGVGELAARLIMALAIAVLCAASFIAGCSTGKDIERGKWEKAQREAIEALREAEAEAGDAFDTNAAGSDTGIAAQREETDDALPEDAGAPIGAADRVRYCIELRRQDGAARLADSACSADGA